MMKKIISQIFSWISDHLRLVFSVILRLEIGTEDKCEEESKDEKED